LENYLPDVLKPFGNISSFQNISTEIIRRRAEKEFDKGRFNRALHAFAYVYRERPSKRTKDRISQCFAGLNMKIFQLIWDRQNPDKEEFHKKINAEIEFITEYIAYSETFFRGQKINFNQQNPYIKADKLFFQQDYRQLQKWLDQQKNDNYGIFLFQKTRADIILGKIKKINSGLFDPFFQPVLEIYLTISNPEKKHSDTAKYSISQMISSEQIFLYTFLNSEILSQRFQEFPGENPNPFWVYTFRQKKSFDNDFPLEQWKSFVQEKNYRFFTRIIQESVRSKPEIFTNLSAYTSIAENHSTMIETEKISEYHYLFELESSPVWNKYERQAFIIVAENIRKLMLNLNFDIYPLRLNWSGQEQLISYELNPARIILRPDYFFMDENSQTELLYRATLLMSAAINTLGENMNYNDFLRNYWLFNAVSLHRNIWNKDDIRVIENQPFFPMSDSSLQNFPCNNHKQNEMQVFDYQCKLKGIEIISSSEGNLKKILKKIVLKKH
jgi:hypothetical protein